MMFFVRLSWMPMLSRMTGSKCLQTWWSGGRVVGNGRQAYETSPTPHHWLNRPREVAMKTRLRIPGVENTALLLIWATFISASSVFSICLYSSLTKSELSSPSAWYLRRMAYASLRLPFDTSHRGDSGTKQMKQTWRRLGTTWRNEGILHPQLLDMENVHRVTAAAAIAPVNN